MQMPVFTSTLRVERRLYKLWEWELPRPLEMMPTLAACAALALEVFVFKALQLPVRLELLFIYVAPLVGAYWAVSQPVADHKRAHEWLYSHVRYLFEPRMLAGLDPVKEPKSIRLRIQSWERKERAV